MPRSEEWVSGMAPALFCVGGKKYSSLYSPFGAREYPL